LVVQVSDNAGERILFVGTNGTALHTGRIETVVAGCRDRLLDGSERAAPVEQTDRAPDLVLVEPIKAMTRRDARFASGTRVELDLECVLLVLARLRERNEVPVVPLVPTVACGVMLREPLDSRERLLLS
jgi:hypothetical protein